MDEIKLFEQLCERVGIYNVNALPILNIAYDMASKKHKGQIRKSGEPYIIHPLEVAIILSGLQVDVDTLCAAILHDTVEDTDLTLEEIEREFNKDVAMLVDGVTKIGKMEFPNDEEARYANIRKLLLSMKTDIRIILIKLADRLHNMRTLQYIPEHKQKENSMETMDLFVPIAYQMGAYRIMHELQDRSFSYINPEEYKKYEKIYNELNEKNIPVLEQMKDEISETLKEQAIYSYIKVRTKNIYGIYDRIVNGGKELSEIHDLHSLKIMINELDDCYKSLRYIHNLYRPFNGKFKDYICSPKPNMYQSLHTTLFGPDNLLVQAQIRTPEQDTIASFGVATYWSQKGIDSRNEMQSEFESKYKFFETIENMDKMFGNNKAFVETAERELLGRTISVYSKTGEYFALPQDSTVIDYAYKLSEEKGNTFEAAIVNDQIVPGDYVLHDGDRVIITTKKEADGPKLEWAETAKTELAKRNILALKKAN